MVNKESKNKEDKRWLWGVITVLVLFVVAHISVVVWATMSHEGLDDVDYYRHGVEYGDRLDERQTQLEEGWVIRIETPDTLVAETSFLIVCSVAIEGKLTRVEEPSLTLGRPATRSQDKKLELTEEEQKLQAETSLQQGFWDVKFQGVVGTMQVSKVKRIYVEPGRD